MKYNLQELPINQFKLLGLDKKDVLRLPSTTLMALLEGKKTELLEFQYNNAEKPIHFKGKFSLKSFDGNIELILHPIKNKLKNDFELSKEELRKLQNNPGIHSIEKEIKIKEGGKTIEKNVLIYLDKDINQLIAVDPTTIKVPESINDTVLTELQKTEFKQGKAIKINDDRFLFNPTNELGLSEQNERTKNILKFKADSYSYNKNAFLLDLALLGTGLGSVFMLGHLLRVFDMDRELYRQKSNKAINPDAIAFDKQLKEALKADFKEIKQNVIENAEPEFKNIKKEGIEGKLLDFGSAPYQDKAENQISYFVEIEKKDGEIKKIWSLDLQKAISESEAKKGQEIKLIHKGTQKVNIKIPIEDSKTGTIVKYRVKEIDKNFWEITAFKNIAHTTKNDIDKKLAPKKPKNKLKL